MNRVFCMLAAAFMLGAAASPARADCVPMREARDLIQSGAVIPLRAALRAARGAAPGELIDGKLCHGGAAYQYIVTFLTPDGRVVRVTVDAKSGDVAGVR